MAEFKKDPRDGVYKFIEINPRFWLTHSLTGAAGIDFVYLYYLSMTEQQPIPHLVQKRWSEVDLSRALLLNLPNEAKTRRHDVTRFPIRF